MTTLVLTPSPASVGDCKNSNVVRLFPLTSIVANIVELASSAGSMAGIVFSMALRNRRDVSPRSDPAATKVSWLVLSLSVCRLVKPWNVPARSSLRRFEDKSLNIAGWFVE